MIRKKSFAILFASCFVVIFSGCASFDPCLNMGDRGVICDWRLKVGSHDS